MVVPFFPRPDRPVGPRTLTGAAAAAVVLTAAACSRPVRWRTPMCRRGRPRPCRRPAGPLLEDSGKILNRASDCPDASNVPAGNYTLTIDLRGRRQGVLRSAAWTAASSPNAGPPATAAAKPPASRVPAAGTSTLSTSSVDAPLIYAYHLAVVGVRPHADWSPASARVPPDWARQTRTLASGV